MSSWQFGTARALMSQVRNVLELRQQIVEAAPNESTTPPTSLQTAFEVVGTGAALTQADRELAALDGLSAARQARIDSHSATRAVGLLGTDPDADLAAARKAFAAGDRRQGGWWPALKKAGVDAVLCTGAYQAAAAFVRDVRDGGWKVPVSNISFVGSDSMLTLLVEEGKKAGKDLTKGLVNSQIVPSYDDVSLPAVKEYRDLMDKWKPVVPADLVDPSFAPPRYSFNSLEGFLNAKILVEAFRRTGPELTRARFRAALESITEWDPGIGAAVTFSPTRHQGLDRVYFTTVSAGRWVGVADWRQAVTA